MPRASTAPEKPSRQDNKGLELAKHKLKLRNHREEIANLKRSGKVKDLRIARLQMAVDYLTRTAESEGEAEESRRDLPLVAPQKLHGK
jgi:hypothetical protein